MAAFECPNAPEAVLALEKRKDMSVISDILCRATGWRGLTQVFREEEDVMRGDDHILDLAFNEMPGRAKPCIVGHRTVGMVIGVEQARGTTTTMRRLCP